VAVNNRKFSWVVANRPIMEAASSASDQNGYSVRRTLHAGPSRINGSHSSASESSPEEFKVRPLHSPRCFVKLGSRPSSQFQSVTSNHLVRFRSTSPRKNLPPSISRKRRRSQFLVLFRAGLRRRPLPNQTNHLARLRLAGLRDSRSHYLCLEHSAKPNPRIVAGSAATEATTPAVYCF